MTRETLMMAAVLAFSIITSAHPVKAQCAPLTLTANGSSSLPVSPGSRVTFAGVLSNCATQAANVSPSFAITSNGTTLTTDTVTYVLAARENHPFRVAFEERFWCNELGTYALALDGRKRPCRAKTTRL